MKLLLLSSSLLLAIHIQAQPTQPTPLREEARILAGKEADAGPQLAGSARQKGYATTMRSLMIPASVDLSDTLGTKRRLFKTDIYKKGEKLSNAAIIKLLDDTRQAQTKYRLGNLLKPVAALVAVSGLYVGYQGIKGTEETAMIRGIRTPTNPNVPDVPAEYTKRSLPKVLGGLGLFVGALCLLELSNELTAKAVVLYNTKSVSQTSTAQVRVLKMGLTSTGNLGLEAHF